MAQAEEKGHFGWHQGNRSVSSYCSQEQLPVVTTMVVSLTMYLYLLSPKTLYIYSPLMQLSAYQASQK